MDEFPFDEDDWFEVKEAAALVTNAVVYWDDLDLVTSAREQLFEKLAELAHKYGEHPVLIETQADFEDDDNQQVILYLRAIDLAELNHLPTLTSRLSSGHIQQPARLSKRLPATATMCGRCEGVG